MMLTVLALAELVALALGAWAARRLVRRIGRGEPRLVVMVAVSAWLVLFGLLPFFLFGFLVPTTRSTPAPAGALQTLVLNAVPFALAASPVLGLIHGLVVARDGRLPG